MAVTLSGWNSNATSSGATITSLALSYAGWPQGAPQPGDLLLLCGVLSLPSLTVTQTAGTGAWTVLSSATNSGGSFTSFTAQRIMGTSDTDPTFGWGGGSAENAYMMCSLTGSHVGVDVSSLHQYIVSAPPANTFLPDPLTGAGADELSLILTAGETITTGANPVNHFPPPGWTSAGPFSVADTGGGAGLSDYVANASWQGNVAGTVTPSNVQLISAAGLYADVLHLLVQELAFPAWAENVDPAEPMPGWFPGAPGMPLGVPFKSWPGPSNIEPMVPSVAAYGGAAADLGGGSGSWVNPGNAGGAPDAAYATWTVP